MLILAVQYFCIVIVILVTGGLFARFVGFMKAADNLNDVEGRIPSSPVSLHELLPVLEDYNAVVQAIPVIPSSIYRMRRERLSELWRDREGERDG